MAILESQVIQQGTVSAYASPQRHQQLSSTSSQEGCLSVQETDHRDDEGAYKSSAEHTALQHSIIQLQRQLKLKDFILDSLEDLIPPGHVDQVSQVGHAAAASTEAIDPGLH